MPLPQLRRAKTNMLFVLALQWEKLERIGEGRQRPATVD